MIAFVKAHLMLIKKIVTLLCLLAGFAVANAQSGEIAGKVTDSGGISIGLGATVMIVDSSGRSTGKGTTTDLDGNYSIKPLKPGTYNLKYSLVGYIQQVKRGLVVSADKTTFVDVRLKSAPPPPGGYGGPPGFYYHAPPLQH